MCVCEGVFDKMKANHVLVNEYLAGQGIMPHTDGPLFYPVISTISCGSHTILRFHENDTEITNDTDTGTDTHKVPENRKLVCELLIEPRSLLILKDDMYTKYLHSIAEQTHDTITTQLANLGQCADDELKNQIGGTIERNRRISLTIRHVPKTTKIRLRLGHWSTDMNCCGGEREHMPYTPSQFNSTLIYFHIFLFFFCITQI